MIEDRLKLQIELDTLHALSLGAELASVAGPAAMRWANKQQETKR